MSLTEQYNTLVGQCQSLQTDNSDKDRFYEGRVAELEDMNLKWQSRYESQAADLERMQEWIDRHSGDAQSAQLLQ